MNKDYEEGYNDGIKDAMFEIADLINNQFGDLIILSVENKYESEDDYIDTLVKWFEENTNM